MVSDVLFVYDPFLLSSKMFASNTLKKLVITGAWGSCAEEDMVDMVDRGSWDFTKGKEC